MKPNAIRQRLSRLQRECDIDIGPVWLLAAACATLVLVLGLDALLEPASPAQAARLSQQAAAPVR